MVEKSSFKPQVSQISDVVYGFMKLWAEFEAGLPGELAKTQNMNGEAHDNANYELFYRLASIIRRQGNLTMGEVANVLSASLSSATRTIDLLVERGYVERVHDAGDRRVVRVALTGKGNELYGVIDKYINRRIEAVFSLLTRDERKILFSLFHKMGSYLKKTAG